VAYQYGYEPQDALVVLRGSGVVSMPERLAIVEQILADPSLPATASVLIDVTEVDRSGETPDIEAITNLVRRLRSRFHARIAIVNSAVGHAMVSYLVALAIDDSSVRAFVSQTEARPWLLGETARKLI
jgi:hypothetical protein